ncbi:hypothetical protein GCM10028775_19100 [Catellatospora paridis]
MTDPVARGLWMAISVLAAVIAAAAVGVLAWAGGASLPAAALTAAGAFVSGTALLISVLRFVAGQGEES